MLVLEDLHAADTSSLLLLRFVAQTLADARLLVIATTRYSDQTATESFAGTVADLASRPAVPPHSAWRPISGGGRGACRR